MAIHHHIYHHRNLPAIVMRVSYVGAIVPFTPQLKKEYERLFTTQVIKSDKLVDLNNAVQKIVAGKPRYSTVSSHTGVPWYVIGVIHYMECSNNFACHLHNGDPLTGRTVNAPAHRPIKGMPPFKWEDSAVDALAGFKGWTDWGIAGTLYRLELYNGFGSRNHGVATPYLWGGTTFYTKGKYVADDKWNAAAVSSQIGAAAILHRMHKLGLIQIL